jgi:hypothetical protein
MVAQRKVNVFDRLADSMKDAYKAAVPLMFRLCIPCGQVGGRAQHGLCTDPGGAKEECSCYMDNDYHRRRWGQWVSPDDDMREGVDGLGNSYVGAQWEWNKEKHERLFGV